MDPRIIYVHGFPCAGKSFVADYLGTLGWHNVDGDQHMYSQDPEVIANGKLVGQCIAKIAGKKDLEDSDTAPLKKHLTTLCEEALKSQQQGKNAAISFVAYTKWMRDFVRSLIPDVRFISI